MKYERFSSRDANETRRSVLEAISDRPVSGPDLADSLKVSRAAIWKHIDELRNAGFEIESGPHGYELVAVASNGLTRRRCARRR